LHLRFADLGKNGKKVVFSIDVDWNEVRTVMPDGGHMLKISNQCLNCKTNGQ
jgi:hypothetical protein